MDPAQVSVQRPRLSAAATARLTARTAFAPNSRLFGVPSISSRRASTPSWSVPSSRRFGAMRLVDVARPSRRPCRRVAALVAVAQLEACGVTVLAPEGTIARPIAPSASSTVASTVDCRASQAPAGVTLDDRHGAPFNQSAPQ
jgi:hypothetical protein